MRLRVHLLLLAIALSIPASSKTLVAADDTSAPGGDTSAPADDTSAPADDTSAPAGDTSAPAGDVAAPADDAFALLITTLQTADDATRSALLKGMLSGLEGRRHVSLPKGWRELSVKLANSDSAAVRDQALKLSQIFGDRSATDTALALIGDPTAGVDRRRGALRLLLNQQNRQASQRLESLLDDPNMVIDAIRGYAMVENPKAASVLLARIEGFDIAQRRAVIETLASRKSYAQSLLDALQSGVISRDEIPAQVARSLTDLLGDPFTKLYGQVRPFSADRTKALAHYKQLCNPPAVAAASASRGRVLFQKTCAACHLLYGQGGNVGPDLTGSNRANLDYILLNSIDPSYDVPDAYKTVTVLTTDGRVVNGVLAEEDAARIVLKTPGQPRVVIAREDIQSRKTSPKSMMPDGQLDQLNPAQVLDLIKYLRTTEQVPVAR